MSQYVNQENNAQLQEVGLYNLPGIISGWVKYFVKKWWLIALFGIAGGLSGVLYAAMQTTKYEGKLTFALDEGGSSNMSGALSLASAFGLDVGSSKDLFSGDNIIQILKSRRILQRVLLSPDTLNGKIISIADEMVEVEGLKKSWNKNHRYQNVSFPLGRPMNTFTYLQDTLLYVLYNDVLLKNIEAQKVDKKLSIYELKYISKNERFVKVVITKLVAEASSFYTELSNRHSKEVLTILENRVAEMKGSAKSAISSRAAIQDANVNPAFAAAQAPVQNRQLDITVYSGAYAELYKNLELARYRFLQSTPLMQIIDEPQYPMKKIKDGRLKTGLIGGLIGLSIVFFLLTVGKLFTSRSFKYAAAP